MEGLTMTKNDFIKKEEDSRLEKWEDISRNGRLNLDVAKNLLLAMREKYPE